MGGGGHINIFSGGHQSSSYGPECITSLLNLLFIINQLNFCLISYFSLIFNFRTPNENGPEVSFYEDMEVAVFA